jgi:hypothetical protein
MKHIEENWQAEYEWIRGIREQEIARMETPQPADLQGDWA